MNNKLFTNICLIGAFILGLSSCVNDHADDTQPEDADMAYLIVQGDPMTRSTFPPDAALDNNVTTLRIMAFEPGTGQIKSNIRYNASTGQEIKHPIAAGTYDFVFIANEPLDETMFNALEGITLRSGLNGISISAAAINSTWSIPMSQEINNVEVLSNSGGANVSSDPYYTPGNTHNPLVLRLNRLATRVDILLEAEVNLDDYFKGVTFSKVASGVPVIGQDNSSAARTVARAFTISDNSEYFTKVTTFTQDQQDRNITWAYSISRFILPYSNFSPEDDDSKAIVFTVNMENRFSPYCNLEKLTDDFTLKRDEALLICGVIKMPLELNITVSPWGEESADWNMQDRRLEVSDVDVSITDFNGARITFSSNLPQVKVLPQVYVDASGSTTMETEDVFNDLILRTEDTPSVSGTETTYSTTRYSYTYDSATGTGTGYMDILLDEYNLSQSDLANYPDGRKTTFRLILSGEENVYGSKLQREIKVHTSQYGFREKIIKNWYSNIPFRYAGAFFRENETGERIIMGQIPKTGTELGTWSVSVDAKYINDIVLSTTPSFDPFAGTDNPGDAEQYPVIPNEYKSESGSSVSGRGRVYFRVAWKTPNPNSEGAAAFEDGTGKKVPRYAVITCKFYDPNPDQGLTNNNSYKIYLRQGEAPDYIWPNGDTFEIKDQEGPTDIKHPRDKSRRFAPFNITDPLMYGQGSGYTKEYETTPVNGGEFVDYPTQSGAFYHWVVPDGSAWTRRAYHPTNPIGAVSAWPLNNIDKFFDSASPIWADTQGETEIEGPLTGNQASYEPGYGAKTEVCPAGYRRPTDGYDDRVSFNGIYPNFKVISSTNHNSEVNNYYNPVTMQFFVPAGRHDYRSQVSASEWRQSIWKIPTAGETVPGSENVVAAGTIDTDITVLRERNARGGAGRGTDIFLENGFYADGFFDRRPIKVSNSVVGVALNTPGAAFRGAIYYNNNTMASLFLPAGGRRSNTNGALDGAGSTGFYWSSSLAPSGPKGSGFHNRFAWGVELNYSGPGSIYTVTSTGHMIRCVKDE